MVSEIRPLQKDKYKVIPIYELPSVIKHINTESIMPFFKHYNQEVMQFLNVNFVNENNYKENHDDNGCRGCMIPWMQWISLIFTL